MCKLLCHITSTHLRSAGSHINRKAQPDSELLWQASGFCFEEDDFEAGPAPSKLQNWQGVALVDAAVTQATSSAHTEMSKKCKYHCRTLRCLRGKTDLRRVKTAFYH